VADNPYLAEFYADMRQWSFHLQVFFLGHRARQHLALANSPVSAIADRSIYEDAHIFARALHHLGNLSERDYAAYRNVFNLVVERSRAFSFQNDTPLRCVSCYELSPRSDVALPTAACADKNPLL
jgi:deoxyadenosine/deoxycytidine kinase